MVFGIVICLYFEEVLQTDTVCVGADVSIYNFYNDIYL